MSEERERHPSETPTDVELLCWLEDFLLTGCLETGFEMDGGIYATFRSPGDEPVEFRDHDNFRLILTKMYRGDR